jgi:hypothetical protein
MFDMSDSQDVAMFEAVMSAFADSEKGENDDTRQLE